MRDKLGQVNSDRVCKQMISERRREEFMKRLETHLYVLKHNATY